jgi:hypothetical protein
MTLKSKALFLAVELTESLLDICDRDFTIARFGRPLLVSQISAQIDEAINSEGRFSEDVIRRKQFFHSDILHMYFNREHILWL